MSYSKPAFMEGPTVQVQSIFSPVPSTMPKFDYPITPKENFYRALRHDNPLWVPLPSLELQELHMSQLYTKGPEGKQLGPKFSDPRPRYSYTDAWGNSWTHDKDAGGSCMTIGTRICDDILKWEEQIPWPDLHEWNLEETAEAYLREKYDPTKPLNLDIYHGPFQAMADFLGGFAEALEAMFVEPEASAALLNRFADWMIWLIDKLSSLYPVDMFTVHDDWGTEKDAFFSPAMMRELLFEPTKRIIDHVHGLGKLYQFHCCGKIDRFLPAFVELGTESTQIQRRVNDIPEYKRLYGGKIGFMAPLEGWRPGLTEDEAIALVQDNMALYAPTGGWLPMVFGDPKFMWTAACELYYGSREYYEKQK